MFKASDIVFGGISLFSEALQVLDLIQRGHHALDDESQNIRQSSKLLEELDSWSTDLAESSTVFSQWMEPTTSILRSIRDILERIDDLTKEASKLHDKYDPEQTKVRSRIVRWNASDYLKFDNLLQDVEDCIKEFKRNADQIAGIQQSQSGFVAEELDAITGEEILKHTTCIRNDISIVRRRLASLGLKTFTGSNCATNESQTSSACDGYLPGMGSWTTTGQDNVPDQEDDL